MTTFVTCVACNNKWKCECAVAAVRPGGEGFVTGKELVAQALQLTQALCCCLPFASPLCAVC
jgi:hypothetical protein